MRHPLAALLVATVTSTAAGCKDRSRAPAATAGSAAARDAAVATTRAPAVPKTGAFAPAVGSWAHAVPLSRCVVRLKRAPEPEIERIRAAAVADLAALGTDIEIEMSDLGDRVHRADIVTPRLPPARAVLNAKTMREIARATLIEHAAIFGLTDDEARHAKLEAERVRDFPGVAWEVSTEIKRDGTGPMPVRTGQGLVIVEIDKRGAVVGIDVDPDLLPPVTVCTDTLAKDRVAQVVVGRPLEWEGDDGPTHAGTVGPDEIQETTFRVRVVRGAGDEGDVTIGGVMEVKVEHDFLPWLLLVDPSAGIVIESAPDYSDD